MILIPLLRGDSVVGISTRLQAGRLRDRIPVAVRLVFCSPNRPTGSGAHPASYTVGAVVHSRGKSGGCLIVNTHLDLAPGFKKE